MVTEALGKDQLVHSGRGNRIRRARVQLLIAAVKSASVRLTATEERTAH